MRTLEQCARRALAARKTIEHDVNILVEFGGVKTRAYAAAIGAQEFTLYTPLGTASYAIDVFNRGSVLQRFTFELVDWQLDCEEA